MEFAIGEPSVSNEECRNKKLRSALGNGSIGYLLRSSGGGLSAEADFRCAPILTIGVWILRLRFGSET